jgi:transposase
VQFKEEAVKLVIEGSRPIAAVARELGVGEATLGNWVNAYRREHAGEEPALNSGHAVGADEAERLRQSLGRSPVSKGPHHFRVPGLLGRQPPVGG